MQRQDQQVIEYYGYDSQFSFEAEHLKVLMQSVLTSAFFLFRLFNMFEYIKNREVSSIEHPLMVYAE